MIARINILFITLAALIGFGGLQCQAQNPPAPVASSDAVLIKQIGNTGAFYFKRKDVISGNAFFYALGSVDDVDQENDLITMTFSFQMPGKTLTKPETVSLSITSKSRDAKYANNHKLLLIADGNRIVDGETEITRPRREGTSYPTEIFAYNAIRFKELETLAKAKKLVVIFGGTKITLGTEQHREIKDFYQLFKD